MPVPASTVVPTRVGADVMIKRATLAALAVFMPRFTPLTRNAALPAVWTRLAAVRVAALVPPKVTVMAGLPVMKLLPLLVTAPTVSVEESVSLPL